MVLCDKLEAGLVQAQTDGGKLIGLLCIMCWRCDVEILEGAEMEQIERDTLQEWGDLRR